MVAVDNITTDNIDKYIQEISTAYSKQPQIWGKGAIIIDTARSVDFPSIADMVNKEKPKFAENYTEVKINKYGMVFRTPPEPEKLAKFMDEILTRLCYGADIKQELWNGIVDPEELSNGVVDPDMDSIFSESCKYGTQKYRLILRGDWDIKLVSDFYRELSALVVMCRVGTMAINDVG